MFPNLLIVLILSIQSLTILKVNCDSCPARGKIGGPIVPDVLSLTKGQFGFSAIVEIISSQQESIMVNDTYNGAKRFGHIEVNRLFNRVKSEIFYYHETNEKYVIESDYCQSDLLNLSDKYTTIGSWLVPDLVSDQVTLFGDMDYLGPTVLMIWAKSVSEKVQFVATENIDGRSVKHWFHCLNENIWIDFWFDGLNNLPFRFSISQSSSSSSTNNPHVYNFLIFNPIKTSPSDRVSYPIGYACARSIFGLPPVPSFLQSDSFSLDMEAMISNSELDKLTISSVHMIKYQGTYSFQVTDSFNTTRIIQNPNHRGRYIVDVSSGQCQLDNVDYKEIQEDNLAIKWPYHYDASFNLLQTISSTSAAFACYMGQVDTDAGLMDIWEEKIFSFFSSGYNMAAVVSYYFPTIDRSSKPHQAPKKISIKLVNPQDLPLQDDLPDQIEINFIDYTEQVDIQFSDEFDVSGCYDGPGQFTWFQIIMSDSNIVEKVRDVNEIRNYFQQSLTSFIPVIRIPEIVVNIYDSNYYITGKLLKRPPFIFNYEPDPQYYIDNPTSILIRDALEDCGELCTNDLNCKEFSYCSDSTCQIFSSTSTYSSISMKDECTWYRRRSFDVGSTLIEQNILASSRSILSQIKSKVNNGQFMMTKYSMSTVDLFIVSGPEEVGNLEEELTDYQINPLKGDEYTVIAPVRRLSSANGQSTVSGVSYSDCLKLCQNDDDCYTLSYCNDDHYRECTLSMETKENLTKSLQDKTSYADNCNIFEKSFVAFYRKLPGQSLVKDSVLTLFDIEESECARVCYESSKIPCKSFDFCLQSTESHGESSQRACFLHQFHVAEDRTHEIAENIWDFSKSTCDHYAVKYDRDYVQYIGRQYKMDKVTIINEINDVSMERCAVDCNQSDDYVNCISFEYCESLETRGSSNIRTTCKLSSTLTTGANDLSSLDSSSTAKSTCSVYLNKDRAAKLLQFKGQQQDHFVLAIGLGSFFFLASFMLGAVASIYYKRKFS